MLKKLNIFSSGLGTATWLATACVVGQRERKGTPAMLEHGLEEPVCCESTLQMLGGGGAAECVSDAARRAEVHAEIQVSGISKQLKY